MTDQQTRRLSDRAGIARTRIPIVAHAFVILAVIALAVGPTLVVQRLGALQEEITAVVQPARRLGTELRLAFERQVAEQRGFHLARVQNEPGIAERSYRAYRAARADELALYDSLAPLAHRISDSAVHQLRNVQTISGRWHQLDDALLVGSISLEAYAPALPGQRALQDSAYAELARLQAEIGRAEDESIATTTRRLRRDLGVALLLGFIALLAAAGVAWSARREYMLARTLARSVEEESRLRDESERRREELEHVTESRARLIRGFSHDVKNPLGAADGYLQLLEDGIYGELSAKHRESTAKARRSLGSALGLIEDLLELARAETGRISLELVGIDISRVVRETTEQFRAQAEAKGLTLHARTGGELFVRTDGARVGQILANLVSNAVKYTERGDVTLSAERRTDGAAPAPGEWVAVDVADTGPGIPADKRRFLFQEFSRLEPGASRGAGIGLAISRHIAHALRAEITFESEVGRGSTFTLWLPVDPEDAGAAES